MKNAGHEVSGFQGFAGEIDVSGGASISQVECV